MWLVAQKILRVQYDYGTAPDLVHGQMGFNAAVGTCCHRPSLRSKIYAVHQTKWSWVKKKRNEKYS